MQSTFHARHFAEKIAEAYGTTVDRILRDCEVWAKGKIRKEDVEAWVGVNSPAGLEQ